MFPDAAEFADPPHAAPLVRNGGGPGNMDGDLDSGIVNEEIPHKAHLEASGGVAVAT